KKLNYGLVGAAGYATMMVWHGGLSGSATTKSMEEGAIIAMMEKANITGDFPSMIPFEQTIGSTMNIVLTLLCLIIVPTVLYFVGKRKNNEEVPSFPIQEEETIEMDGVITGAERLD